MDYVSYVDSAVRKTAESPPIRTSTSSATHVHVVGVVGQPGLSPSD
jgi:hypothetical protein